MPAPATIGDFLELVRKSGIVEEKKLDAYLETLRNQGAAPATPSALAERMIRDGQLTNFQVEQLLLGKWRRFSIGKYKVLEKLGSGGMGSVYLCEHKLMRRRVAVKVLPAAKADDPSSLERFYREAKAIAALDHPNIVRAYDIDQDEKLHFLVMEHVDGVSLQDVIKKNGPMDVLRACHYIRQAAEGLQHAHETAGLVHRDIKPGNILVDRGGTIKILDMGLARFFHDEEDVLTKKYDENVLGTADYLAPEQALDSHAVDIRADIYSLGATFYYCLTGRTPFTEGSVAQKLIWHQTRAPKPIRALRMEVPETLVAVVDRMMAKEPADRYQTPQQAAEALVPFTQTPIPPPPEEEMPRLSPAAMAGIVPSSDTRLAAPTGPGSGTRKNWQTTAGSSVPAASLPPRPAVPRTPPPAAAATRPAQVATAPRPAAAAKPTARPEAGSQWEPLASETGKLGQTETPPRSAHKQAAAPADPPTGPETREPDWRRWLVIAAVALIVLAVVFTLGMLAFRGLPWIKKAGKDDGTPGQGRTLLVSQKQANAYHSVREALDNASPGDHIRVVDEVHREQFDLKPHKWNPEVTIEAGADGRRVVWATPEGAQEGAILKLQRIEGLHFRGFTFDGEDRMPVGIRLVDHCPGVVLEDLRVQGCKEYDVQVWNCEGEPERRVALLGLQTRASRERPAALSFETFKEMALSRNQYFTVRDCRFEGPYKQAAQRTGVLDLVDWQNNVWVKPGGVEVVVPLPQPL